ncbi:MAG: MotA/TolQ/ExbB proton channel family protein [Rickettsiales bacterium]|jgi:biopolymer transport protein ExbB/TolQ|nr:MotA/TolQ/ExbB proton channel family protein [Rickettsiales bacterium]
MKSVINPEDARMRIFPLRKSLINAAAFVAVLAVAVAAGQGSLRPIWGRAIVLNSVILCAFAAGVAANMADMFGLIGAARWLDAFFDGKEAGPAPEFLRPASFQLSRQKGRSRGYLPLSAMRELLEITGRRLKERAVLPRYIASILVFLGLLGTFWGLMLTLGGAGEIVRGGSSAETLRQGLIRPMDGMGAAFSTSLFGLGASLALGFVGLQRETAGKAFYDALECAMLSYARPAVGADGGGDSGAVQYLQAMLEQTADNLNSMQRLISKQAESGAEAGKRLAAMTNALSALAVQMEVKLKALERISRAPEKLYSTLHDLVKISKSGFGMDDNTKEHIRSIDYRIDEMTQRLSSDIRLLAKK